jgi:2-dehydropantoate 2-reductase
LVKICIIGAGALGCAIGGTLAEAGSEVYLINRNKDHVDAINRSGLVMRAGGTDRNVNVFAATDCSKIGEVDLLIVLVKSFHTREAIEGAKQTVGKNTVVISLQNGLGHEDILGEVIGHEHVIAGKTYVGGLALGPGRIIAGVKGKQTVIGELDGSVSARALAIAEEFNRAGIAVTVSANIRGAMWDKLLVNVATGALSGITRLAYGQLYRVPEVESAAVAAVREGMAVANATGISLSIRDPKDAWIRAGDGLPPEFKASMLQSLEKSSITEIDFINGAVVKAGKIHRVPTPVNETLVACVKGIEHSLEAYSRSLATIASRATALH